MLNTQAFHSLLQSPLPGATAHGVMQPQPPVSTAPGACREAAVLVLLSPWGPRRHGNECLNFCSC